MTMVKGREPAGPIGTGVPSSDKAPAPASTENTAIVFEPESLTYSRNPDGAAIRLPGSTPALTGEPSGARAPVSGESRSR